MFPTIFDYSHGESRAFQRYQQLNKMIKHCEDQITYYNDTKTKLEEEKGKVKAEAREFFKDLMED